MTCVKYDHVFANGIAAKFPNYASLLAAAKQKKRNKKLVKMDSASQKAPRRPQQQQQTCKSLSTATPHVNTNPGDIRQDQPCPIQTEALGSSSTPARRYPQRRCKSTFKKDVVDPGSMASSEDSLSEYEE